MKILHLPINIASQISVLVRAQRLLGQDARGLVRSSSHIQENAEIECEAWGGKPDRATRLLRSIRWRFKVARSIAWADVIHWHWGDTSCKGADLRFAGWLRKPRLVEFWGDDLREPERASADNPYLARMYEQFPDLANRKSRSTQRLFARAGFQCAIPGYELADYLAPGIFEGYYQTRACLILSDYTPCYPSPLQKHPVVVHAPSHKTRKGTAAVLEAVANLSRSHDFVFRLIHDMPRAEALQLVGRCDIFLDQFTIGAEGLAAHEAMALGKPVVCYLKPALMKRYPPDCPIISADQPGLEAALVPLLKQGHLRHQLGRRGRSYIENHHDARAVAAEFLEMYQELINRDGRTLSMWRANPAGQREYARPAGRLDQ